MKELEILLDNYWILKEDNKELYYRIKDNLPVFKSFISEKLGYHILTNQDMIKLEKLPGKAESWMGIPDFDDTMEYAFLCLLLMFLEDKSKEEQFVLSQITEFIQAHFPGDEKVDWTLFRHRRHLIKVLRFSASIGLLKVDDGSDQDFANNASSEVLYESTGLSRYFVRNFTSSILDFKSYKDLENEAFMEIDRDRGIIRRQRVYRRIVMSPAVYSDGADDADYIYIKQKRSLLERDMEEYLDCSFHVHRNGAMLVVGEGRSYKNTFPENRTLSDIALQMNAFIVNDINNGKIQLRADDTAIVSRAAFITMVSRVKDENIAGWSKEYREMPLDTLAGSVINYMESYSLIAPVHNNMEIEILPLAGKIIGRYPDDFKLPEKEEERHGQQ